MQIKSEIQEKFDEEMWIKRWEGARYVLKKSENVDNCLPVLVFFSSIFVLIRFYAK